MLPETRRKDVSPAELQLRKQDKQTRNLRYFEVFVLVIVVIVQMFILTRVLDNSEYNKKNIEAHSAGAIEQRLNNQAVHNELKAYIRCIILLRYDNPGLNPESPRQDVERALDKCATVNGTDH